MKLSKPHAFLAVSITLLSLSMTSQGATEKHDVCRNTGNGSYHLINISHKAVPAHRAQGSALPGESVPGNPGYVFDENCNQVLASTCPCDFSSVGMAEVGIDGSGPHTCSDVDNLKLTGILLNADGGSPQPEAITLEFHSTGVRSCSRYNLSGTLIENYGSMTSTEFDDCYSDVTSIVVDLSIPGCE